MVCTGYSAGRYMDSKLLGLIIIGAIALLAGCHTLDGELVSDDFVLMDAAERVGIIKMFTSNWLGEHDSGGFFRPIALAVWKLDHMIYGRHPAGYHLTNLLLHLAVSLMVFLLISRFHRSIWIPIAAASLFAVHPVHVEAIAWISGRTDTLATAFYLLSILCFFRASREDSRGSTAGIMALVAGIFAMLSKEIAYTLPFTLFAMSRLPMPESGSRLVRRTTAPYFVSLIVILGLRFLAIGSILGGYGAGKHLRFDTVIFDYLTFYLQWLMEPFSLPGSTSAPVWMILIISGLLLSLGALFSQSYRPGVIWFWITVLPVLNICRAQYWYLPSIGIFWFIAVLVFDDKPVEERGAGDLMRGAGWTVLLVIFLMHSWDKNREWAKTGWVGKGIRDAILTTQPEAQSGTRFVFINPPVNGKINIGVFQNGVREAVRIWYDDPYLDGIRYATIDQYKDPLPGKDNVWLFEEGRIRRMDDAIEQMMDSSIAWPGFETPIPVRSDEIISLPGMDKRVSGVVICSQLANADTLKDDVPVADIRVEFLDGHTENLQLLTGRDTSEWAYDRPDVRKRVRHRRAPVAFSYLAGSYPEEPDPGHTYLGVLMFETPGIPSSLTIRSDKGPVSTKREPSGNQDIQLEIRSISGVI